MMKTAKWPQQQSEVKCELSTLLILIVFVLPVYFQLCSVLSALTCFANLEGSVAMAASQFLKITNRGFQVAG